MRGNTNPTTQLVISAFLMLLAVAANAAGRTIYVDDDGPADFNNIQAAIDDANDGDIIIVQTGMYSHINFVGKNIVLRSTNPTNPAVVEDTVICVGLDRPVTFSGSEDENCVLCGFTITSFGVPTGVKRGGGIFGNGTRATIQHNVITRNIVRWTSGPFGACRGAGIDDCDGNIHHNIISYNVNYDGGLPSSGMGGGMSHCDGTIQYNIITCNEVSAGYGGGLYYCNGIIRNNIISFNKVWSVPESGGGGLSFCDGIIESNTIFGNSAPEGGGLSDCEGIIKNCIIVGNRADIGPQIYSSSEPSYSCIEGWAGGGTGNIDADPCFADTGNGDFHLKSQAGRWDADEGRWTIDDVTSPCIDAGDPHSPIGLEPFPNGGVINMGAYGGTEEASKSYFGEPVCETVVAGDINGDCIINFKDLAFIAAQWLQDYNP